MQHDVFFLSYDEPIAEENYNSLKSTLPRLKRIHGVEGILQAHKECARKSLSKYFFVVDGDNEIIPGFEFEYDTNDITEKHVLVWRSQNPVNGLVYGYGGVKLLPKKLILDIPDMVVDMTTSLSTHFKIIPDLASITHFNSSPYNAWRGAFRECVKLASKSIDRQKDEETEKRLDIWCSKGISSKFGNFVIAGANSGRELGEKNKGNKDVLKDINNFNWLKEKFEEDKKNIT